MKYRNYKITMEVEYADTYEQELNEDGTLGDVICCLTDPYGYRTGQYWYRVYRPNEEYQGSYDTEDYTSEDIKKIIDKDIDKNV